MLRDKPPPLDGALDHHSEHFARDHLDIYRQARAHCPVMSSDAHGGYAIVTRFADIRAILRNHEGFASGRTVDARGALLGGVAIPPNGARIGIIEMDPPQATALRRLLLPWFSIAAVDRARSRIAELSRWIVDSIAAKGACDVVSDIAQPMPSLLILDVLGLPLDRWRAYGRVLHEAVAKASGSLSGMRWLIKDIQETIEARNYLPEGLVAFLATVELEGAPLSRDLICELSMMILFGGTDTTIAAISHMMLHLSRNDDDRARLCGQPDLIPAAVEEVLRIFSPSTGVARTVMKATQIGDVLLQPGARVLCAVNSANRDETVYRDAEIFDMDRPAHPHLAFGAGVHTCLGQHLARADLQILLGDILERIPDFHIDEAGAEPYRTIPLVNGYAAMPMTFTPRAPTRRLPSEAPILTSPRLSPI